MFYLMLKLKKEIVSFLNIRNIEITINFPVVSQIIVSYGAGDDLTPDGEQFFNIIEGDVQVELLIIIFNFSLVLLL